ncbi:MAG: hypothetical protein ACRD1T_09875 [Acidimicrobiia bacterium]
MRRLTGVLLVWLATTTVAASQPCTVTIGNGGDALQAAIDAAEPGDTICLKAGAIFEGNFWLPNKPGASFITIRSATPDNELPLPGQRMTSDYLDLLPVIRPIMPNPAFQSADGAHHYRLLFLYIKAEDFSYSLILLGDGSEMEIAQTPNHVVIDRCYVEGHETEGSRRAVALNGRHIDVLDSTFVGLFDPNAQSQGLMGWNGPGPFRIIGNYIEAGSENIMFGGADPAIPGLIPSDITIKWNTLTKRDSWRVGGYGVVDLIEFKNAQRVLIEANYFYNVWVDEEDGTAIVFLSANQYGECTWCTVRDVTFRHNLVEHAEGTGVMIARWYAAPCISPSNIAIVNNIWKDIGGWFAFISDSPTNVTIDHNTVPSLSYTATVYFLDRMPGTDTGFVYKNNLAPHQSLGFFSGEAPSGTPTLDYH